MSGTVLYRKWRPLDFGEVVGQETVVRTLQNAVAQDKISHAYLFCGPRGTGKTTTARILARAINGRTASSGGALGDGGDLGFDLVEIDAASNRGIDDIRELRERANYQPGAARFKVYLIDEVHQLTSAAEDALLKTLEEPPPHVVFILATTDPESLKPTILSRCQRFDFRRVGVDDMVARLRAIAESEGIEIPDEALRLIAREATGSLRDGVNLLDQVWVMCGASVTLDAAQEALGLSPDARALELASAALHGKLAEGLSVLAAVQQDAIDFARFKRQVVTHLRHVLLTLTGASESLSLSGPELEQLREVGQGVDASAAVTALRAFSEADVRRDPYQPLPLELALASIVYDPPASAAPAPGPAPQPRQQSQSRQQQARRPARDQAQQQRPASPAQERPAARQQPPAASAEPHAAPTNGAAPAPGPASGPSQPPPASVPPDQILQSLRDALRQRGYGLVATMINGSCQIISQNEDTLTLGFFDNYLQMHMPKVLDEIGQVSAAASQVLGRQITVRCVPNDGAAAASASTAPAPAAPSPQSPPPAEPPQSVIAREAVSRFGARPYQAN